MKLPALPNVREAVFSLELRGRDAGALSVVQHGPAASVLGMTTAYIVCSPGPARCAQGAVPAGRHFRRLGHDGLHGAAPVHSPVVMTAAMALWVGACLYVGAGPHAALLSVHAGRLHRRHDRFPSVSEPTLVFDTALARVEEIALGIVCATLVHSVVLRAGAGADAAGQGRARRPALDARHPGRRRRRQVRQGPPHPGQRHHPAAPAVDPRAFDTSNLRWTAGAVRHAGPRRGADAHCLGRRGPHARPGRRPALRNVARLLASISKWIDAGPRATHATALRLRAAAVRLTPAIDSRSSWRDALLASLMTRLRELIDG